MEDVRKHGSLPVPKHLQNAPHRGMRSHGIGVGYKNPHDYEDADVEQQGLPDLLKDRRYYEPSEQGWEARIKERMDALVEARERGSRKRR
jgi:putative ATPase